MLRLCLSRRRCSLAYRWNINLLLLLRSLHDIKEFKFECVLFEKEKRSKQKHFKPLLIWPIKSWFLLCKLICFFFLLWMKERPTPWESWKKKDVISWNNLFTFFEPHDFDLPLQGEWVSELGREREWTSMFEKSIKRDWIITTHLQGIYFLSALLSNATRWRVNIVEVKLTA